MTSLAFLLQFGFLLRYEEPIYLVSAIISFLFALVIFTLRRNARILKDKEWTLPFALTFFVLSFMYLLRFVHRILLDVMPETSTEVIFDNVIGVLIYFCSGVTNFLFFVAGFQLVDGKWLVTIKDKLIGSAARKRALLALLCLLALIPFFKESPEARIPDSIFSVFALGLIGLGIYKRINYRHDKLMARIALWSSFLYIALIIVYTVSRYFETGSKELDLFAFLMSLFAKVGLFFPGYSLMLLISGPVEGIERLLMRDTQTQAGYLEIRDTVKAIREALGVRGVQLHIVLPRVSKNQVALYSYPPSTDSEDEKPQIFDYEENTDYDEVIKARRILTDYRDNHWLMRRIAKIRVPIFLHNSVVATLKAETGEESFTQDDQYKLSDIARSISLLVQAYREMSAQDEISQKLAQLQIDTKTYNIEEDVNKITAVIHEVLCPSTAGISIKAGFSEYEGVAPLNGAGEQSIRERLKWELSEEARTSEPAIGRISKELKISYSTDHEKDGKQTLGEFILALDPKGGEKEPLTLAENLFNSNAMSDLLTNALLNFIRGHLNQLTDILGVRLGGLEETNPEDWIKKVNKTAKDAKLLWAVASYSESDNLLGEAEAVGLVNELERSVKPDLKHGCEKLYLFSLGLPQHGTYHVIKKSLEETEQNLWFGVGRREFDRELDYISPWAFFIDQFCKIADAGLLRILNKRKEEEQKKAMAEFHGLATAAIATGTVMHQLVNLVRSLTSPMIALEVAIKHKRLRGSDRHRALILSLRRTGDQIDEVVKLFAGVVKPDEQQPCSLRQAIEQAKGLLESSLKRRGIVFDYEEVPEGVIIDVPFHVASAALANAVNNSREAIRDGHIKNGLIKIRMEENGHMYICHITDNGPGVPSPVQKTLFEGICKSDKPYSHGMGLYLSARSMRENGGDIRLTHPGPDPSTTFSIYFPKLRNTL